MKFYVATNADYKLFLRGRPRFLGAGVSASSFTLFPGVEVSPLLDFVPGFDVASFFSVLTLFVPALMVEEGSRSDLPALGVPTVVLSRFASSPDDFWLAFLVGGSSLLATDANFLFFFIVPESPVGVVGRLLDLEAEEFPLVSPFSAAAAEAAILCRIRADDGCVVSVLDTVFDGVTAVVVDEFARGRGASVEDVPDSCCCSELEPSFAADGTGCEINGGGKAAGGFARDTLSQLVENHLESAGTRRLLLI